jgi:hypothetical protein
MFIICSEQEVVDTVYYPTGHVTRQTMYCRCNVTMWLVLATIVTVEKQKVLHILRVCFLALGTQHAMRMRLISICGLPRSTLFFLHIIS